MTKEFTSYVALFAGLLGPLENFYILPQPNWFVVWFGLAVFAFGLISFAFQTHWRQHGN